MYKLIATDLDGTFLNLNAEIPAANLHAVDLLKEKGVYLILCSGRPPFTIDRLAKDLQLNRPGCYGIASNGSTVFDIGTGQVLYKRMLSQHTKNKLVERYQQDSRFNLYLYDKNGALVSDKDSEEFQRFNTYTGEPNRLVQDYFQVQEEVAKVVLVGKHEDLCSVIEADHEELGQVCSYFFSAYYFLEFTHLEATKGKALSFLAGHLGIPMQETIAAGDFFNDLSMIQAAGLGVAPQNAHPDIKKAAGYITAADHNEGVLAEIVEKFIQG